MIESPKIRSLSAGFSSEVDSLGESAWHESLDHFEDANIYQTWSYEEVRRGRANLSHLVLKHKGEIVAAAQARLAFLPVIKAGVAYVRWGPMWRNRQTPADPEIFRQAIRALRNEYAGKRGLVLRIYPVVFREDAGAFPSILEEEGFSALATDTPDRTLRLDLTPSPAALREGMRQHWRRYLKVAEKNNLEVIEGDGDEMFEQFIGIYRQLVGRKGFAEPNDINQFREAQKKLPSALKMRILLCKSGDVLCAGLICSAVGDTGIYLFGATSDLGLQARGSYLLHWKLIEWLQQRGAKIYDLHGINPVLNPGTYKFKADLCGSNGKDVHFLGRFDSWTNALSHSCVAGGEKVRVMLRALKNSKHAGKQA